MKRNRVLVAEDEGCIRRLLEELCEASGFSVDAVCDGQAASCLMNSMNGKYDIIFMDLAMPNWDGLDAIETYHGRGKRIVVVSGMIDAELRRYLESHPHVMSILEKPFTTGRIAAILRDVILSSQADQQ
jgi:CheY-like chemotaxis protein